MSSPHVILAWDPAILRATDAKPVSGNTSCQVRLREKRGIAGGLHCLGLFCCPELGLWDLGMPWLLVMLTKQEAASWGTKGGRSRGILCICPVGFQAGERSRGEDLRI